jgi:hypothetical protein
MPPDGAQRGRSVRELGLEEALDRGRGELPANRPRGILGEFGLDMRKTDPSGGSIFGGVTQEVDAGVVWLAMLAAYLLLFPLAYVILWRSRHFSPRIRVGYTIAFTIGVIFTAYALLAR